MYLQYFLDLTNADVDVDSPCGHGRGTVFHGKG